MQKLTVIEHADQRVLTTAQVADGYGTDTRRISENFKANQSRYFEGVHYFKLTGKELADFKLTNTEITESSRINQLYLWTEKGVFLHAKSLNTDKAWDVYNELVDTYFRAKSIDIEKMIKQFNLPRNYPEALKHLLASTEENERLQLENKILQPKAEKYDKFINTDNVQTMLEISKVLQIGRNTLMRFLRIKKIFMSNNLPYAKFCNSELFKTREFTIHRRYGKDINVCQTLATAKGLSWISDVIKEELGGLLYKESTGQIKLNMM